MTRSVRAALLSGLIFPGTGHMVLKQYLRGSLLMLPALMALSVIAAKTIKQAQTVLDRMNSGEIPLEAAAITEMVSQSTAAMEDSTLNIAALVFATCWLVGIIDSYRLGIVEEK